MASLNPFIFMVKTFLCVSLAIPFVSVPCKAKQDKYSRNVNDLLLLYNSSIQVSMNEVSKVSEDFSEDGQLTRVIKDIDPDLQSPIESCREFMTLALYNLNLSSILAISLTTALPHETLVDFKTRLCATIADLETCIYDFEYAPEEARKIVIASMESSRELVSNSLSILYKIDEYPNPNPSSIIGLANHWPPYWMSFEDRKLVFDTKEAVGANVVVAKDGSGNYKTINEAIKVVPQYSTKRFVIYVKEGIYYENVKIDLSKWNVMMYGDGMNKTIVSGNLSSASGASTIASATFSVLGSGFIGRDMGFQNTAGPASMQAVALLSSSDKSVIYKCSIDAYQDSLFTQSNRQFYRECHIYGTIDFIFGQSSSVFQNCTISAKKPLHGQANAITAQGRSNPLCLCGFSIHRCNVVAAEDLGGARTFLGRPWKNFSTTVIMETFLDRLIDPQGWLQWRPGVTPPDTIYYGEYENYGPGSGVGGRVKWKGVRVNMSVEEAENFTVRSLNGGDQWIPATAVPFIPDL